MVGGELGLHVGAAERDEGALVAHGITVVGRREDGDALAVVAHLVAVRFDLVRAHHVVQAVALQEPRRHVRTELDAHALRTIPNWL